MSRYLVVIERDGDAWGAFAPDLPGLGVAGASREEVERLVRGAIEQHLAVLRDLGQPIPSPTAEATFVTA